MCVFWSDAFVLRQKRCRVLLLRDLLQLCDALYLASGPQVYSHGCAHEVSEADLRLWTWKRYHLCRFLLYPTQLQRD